MSEVHNANHRNYDRADLPDVNTGRITELDYDKYLVVKQTDIAKYLSHHRQSILLEQLRCIHEGRYAAGKKAHPRTVVIKEDSPLFEEACEKMLALINKPVIEQQDRLIRTPSCADMLLVAKTFLPQIVMVNPDETKFGGAELVIPFGASYIPWNPWNDPEQALHLAAFVGMRLSYGDKGVEVEYKDERDNSVSGRKITKVASCAQHAEAGLSLSFARKMTQVAVYRAHRLQGTV